MRATYGIRVAFPIADIGATLITVLYLKHHHKKEATVIEKEVDPAVPDLWG